VTTVTNLRIRDPKGHVAMQPKDFFEFPLQCFDDRIRPYASGQIEWRIYR